LRVTRRSLLKAAAAAAGASATGSSASSGCSREQADRPREGLVELAIMSGVDQSPGRQRDVLRRRWARQHPGAQAHFVEIGGVADAHRSQMVAHAQSGLGGVDIYNLDVTWTAEFAQAGYLRPLDVAQLDLSGFLEQPLQTCRYDGKLWALPFNTDAGLLYHRSDLVPEELAPTDWGGIELWTARVFASPDHPAELEAGYAGQLADYEGLTVNSFEMIWFEHGEVVTGDWRDPRIEVDSGAVADALRRLARVATHETPQLILPAASRVRRSGHHQRLPGGQGPVHA
jgi:multiple sugar transport system substrate-binding protein